MDKFKNNEKWDNGIRIRRQIILFLLCRVVRRAKNESQERIDEIGAGFSDKKNLQWENKLILFSWTTLTTAILQKTENIVLIP